MTWSLNTFILFMETVTKTLNKLKACQVAISTENTFIKLNVCPTSHIMTCLWLYIWNVYRSSPLICMFRNIYLLLYLCQNYNIIKINTILWCTPQAIISQFSYCANDKLIFVQCLCDSVWHKLLQTKFV